ncbi:MAG: ABC transporter permease [Spirochaetales bacterium]|nr:ABC transporter permease [Spirochaetales bacterium]
MDHKTSGSSIKTTILALSSAIILTILLLFISSDNPLQSISYFFTGPFSNLYNLGNMLDKAGLLIFAGLGMSIAFRSGVFNLGGEGQVYAGATAAVIVSISFNFSGRYTGIISVISIGIISGALIAGLSGFLKKQWDADELISSFLISGTIIHFTDYLISNPFKDNSSFLNSTVKIPEILFLKQILGSSHFNISFVFAVIISIAAFLFLFRTTTGYELRLSGLNRNFASYGGIPVKRYYIISMLISGGLYGAAGSFAVLGNYHMGIKGFTSGLGWNGIAVALIAGNNPAFVIPAALIFAYLDAGTQIAMIHSDMSFEFSNLIKAIIFFLITARKFSFKKGGLID